MKKLLEKLKARLVRKSKGDAFSEDESGYTDFSATNFTSSTAQDILSENANIASPVKKAFSVSRPPLEEFYPYILGSTIGLMAADVAVTTSRSFMLPDQAPPITRSAQKSRGMKMQSEYSNIVQRNIFNSDGVIPDAINKKEGEDAKPDDDGPAVPSSLPIQVLGTIVHINPAKSVATLKINRGQNKVLPYIPNDDVEGIATVVKVERHKVFIRNNSNRRLEYLEMKLDLKINFGMSPSAANSEVAPGLKKDGNKFKVSKTELQKQLSDLPNILRQARAIPYRDPESGAIAGFKVVDIQPGSIIGELVRRGDIIKAVNGTPINSAAKAMELYRALKEGSQAINLTVDRNGNEEVLNFDFE